jgi:hypothetical protein
VSGLLDDVLTVEQRHQGAGHRCNHPLFGIVERGERLGFAHCQCFAWLDDVATKQKPFAFGGREEIGFELDGQHGGFCGHQREGRVAAFIRYLSRLLANNPDWVWTHESAIPLEDGFLNRWKLDAPVGDRIITCRGVCTVQMTGGLIYRNEVYFDTRHLIAAIEDWNARK